MTCIVMTLVLLGASTNLVWANTDSDSSSSSARASESSQDDWDDGYCGFQVSSGLGNHDWECQLEVSARAGIIRDDAGDSTAYATAYASVSGSGLASNSISVTASVSGTIDTDSDSDSWSDGGTDRPMRGATLDMYCSTEAECEWINAGTNTAIYADSYAYIYASIEPSN